MSKAPIHPKQLRTIARELDSLADKLEAGFAVIPRPDVPAAPAPEAETPKKTITIPYTPRTPNNHPTDPEAVSARAPSTSSSSDYEIDAKPTPIFGLALDIVSDWEGNQPGWHTDGEAYGIIGFTGDWLDKLKKMYYEKTGKRSLGGNAVFDHDMHACQRELAAEYFDKVVNLTIKPRGLESPIAWILAFDMAVNNGIYNQVFVEAEKHLGVYREPYQKRTLADMGVEEMTYVIALCDMREKLYKSVMDKYYGITMRYKWFASVARNGNFYSSVDFPREIDVNHRLVSVPSGRIDFSNILLLPDLRAPATSAVTYGSAVQKDYHGAYDSTWFEAISFNEIYKRPARFRGQHHPGVDLNKLDGRDEGLPIYAVADGRVTFADRADGSWGNLVIVRHDDGYSSRYGHLMAILIAVGTEVKRGQQIGTLGGRSLGYDPHLHLEIAKSERYAGNPAIWDGHNEDAILQYYQDPTEYINQNGWWR